MSESMTEIRYQVGPRGIGSDWTPGCYCCGGDYGLHTNISFFAVDRDQAEAISTLFSVGARTDYRPWEPNWVQVKVGACTKHVPHLERLWRLVLDHKDGEGHCWITASLIEESKSYSNQSEKPILESP